MFATLRRHLQNLKTVVGEFRFWLVLNSVLSLGLILAVCWRTAAIVESIDSEDSALVDSYSDDLQDINNLSIQMHRYNTETMSYILIGDQALVPRLEGRMSTLHELVDHIIETHPNDAVGRSLLRKLQRQFEERDEFVHSMIRLRGEGVPLKELAKRSLTKGRPITRALQSTLDEYTQRRFQALKKSRQRIDLENSRERKELQIIQYLSVGIGVLLTLTLGKILTSLYRKSKYEAEARRQALAIAAHDLKNPLANILGSLELIRSPVTQNALHDKQITEIIERAAHSMKQLVHDYLDIGRLEAGKLTPTLEMTRVGELVANVIQTMRPLADQRGHKLVSEMAMLPGEIFCCDPQQLMQVFSNLIGNAFKFSPIGSTITLRVENSVEGIQFSVIDSGPGIPENHREKVFEQYWQVKKKGKEAGSGLGLSIAKGIVEAHSGKIWVEGNENGQGAKFSFTIPVTKLGSFDQSSTSSAEYR